MNCSYCGRPVKHTIVMTEDVPGVGPERKDSCFSCVSKIAEGEIGPKAACPTCGGKSTSVKISSDSRFEFTCAGGHSWDI